MPLSPEAQALFDHAKRSLPRWITSGIATVLEWLYGFVAIFDPVMLLAQEWLDGIYLDTATGRWLDQHARDRDTTRRLDEEDDVLRERLRQVEDAITDPALQRGVNAIIGASVIFGDPATITISDEDNTTPRTISVPAGPGPGFSYTARQIEDLIVSQLFDGWRFFFLNGRAYFDSRDPVTGLSRDFTVAFSTQDAADALGFFTSVATNWNTATDGWYRSDQANLTSSGWNLPGFCGITHLRRDRAHFGPQRETLIDTMLESTSATTYTVTFQNDGTGTGSTTSTGTDVTFHYQPNVTTIGNFETEITSWNAIHFEDLQVATPSVRPSTVIPTTQDNWLVNVGSVPVKAGDPTVQTGTEAVAFMSRGYRMTYADRPMGYVVLLPMDVAATADAVTEYLRQYGPAGYKAIVEYKNP
jgi:hypothetical protein